MLKRGFEGNSQPITMSKEQERLARAGNVYFQFRFYLRVVTFVLCILSIIYNLGRLFLGYPTNDNVWTIIFGCAFFSLIGYGIIMFFVNVFGTRLLLLYFRIKQFFGK